MTELITTPLFNTSGDDSPKQQSLIGANPTGILNLDECKYKWVKPLYMQMLGNHWIPEKISLVDDRITKQHLTEHEEEAVKSTLSFLIFLDSVQVANLDNIAAYITNAGVGNLLKIQTFQEVIHSQSYQHILQSLWSYAERQEVYERWRDNDVLRQRNQYISGIYQAFMDNKTLENFKRVIIANYLLEGVYFYNGFNFFEQLASRNKLVQTSKEIDYIKTDEGSHLALFLNIIKTGEIVDVREDAGWIYEMFKEAVEQEITWGHYVYGNNIMGISERSTDEYMRWIGNNRLNAIGLDKIFGNVDNPYKHLEGAKETNFFEAGGVTDYDRADSVAGWDDF